MKWILRHQGQAEYTFKNKKNNLYLFVPSQSEAGVVVKTEDQGKFFTIEPVSGTNYKFNTYV